MFRSVETFYFPLGTVWKMGSVNYMAKRLTKLLPTLSFYVVPDWMLHLLVPQRAVSPVRCSAFCFHTPREVKWEMHRIWVKNIMLTMKSSFHSFILIAIPPAPGKGNQTI